MVTIGGRQRRHCDVVVGADLVYSADVGKTVQDDCGAGCSRVYYCAPSTGRAGSRSFGEAEKLSRPSRDRCAFSCSEAPCGDAALYFPDLAQSKFKLHTFVRQEPASPSYQAMACGARRLKSGKLREVGRKALPCPRSAQAHHDAEGRQAREGGHPGRPVGPAAAAVPLARGTIRRVDRRAGAPRRRGRAEDGPARRREPCRACTGPGAIRVPRRPKERRRR